MAAPRYPAIADTIRGWISDGKYLPGTAIPSERFLRREFAVSNKTVWRAIYALQAEGLLVSRQGSGVYVAPAPDVIISPGSWLSGEQYRAFRNAYAAAMRDPNATAGLRMLGPEAAYHVWWAIQRAVTEDARRNYPLLPPAPSTESETPHGH